jgi:hypothetical protein
MMICDVTDDASVRKMVDEVLTALIYGHSRDSLADVA